MNAKKLLLISLCLFNLNWTQAQDPALQWAKGMTGNYYDESTSIAVDAAGNVYTTGAFQSTVDFNPGTGDSSLTTTGDSWISDIFISKLDASGNFVWARKIGGTGQDKGVALDVNENGDVFVVGAFEQTVDFNPSPTSTHNLTATGDQDLFLLKLNANGSFGWAYRIGSAPETIGASVEVDDDGNVILGGCFTSNPEFNTGTGTFSLDIGFGYTCLAKFDENGNCGWAKQYTQLHSITDIGLDASGNIYATGSCCVADSRPDAFVLKTDGNGNEIWKNMITGTASSGGSALCISPAGNIYFTGTFSGSGDLDLDPGVATFMINNYDMNSPLFCDLFLVRWNTDGEFVWGHRFGNMDYEISEGIALDALENIYVTGYFRGGFDVDPSSAIQPLTSLPDHFDIMILKYDSLANFVWARNIGNTSDDNASAIEIDPAGYIYVTGSFVGIVDFDPGAGDYPLIAGGIDADVFVMKMDQPITAIHETKTTETFQLYPNPAQDFITIKTSENTNSFRIELIDGMGKSVYTNTYSTNEVKIPLTGYTKGLYLLRLTNGQSFATKEIVIE